MPFRMQACRAGGEGNAASVDARKHQLRTALVLSVGIQICWEWSVRRCRLFLPWEKGCSRSEKYEMPR